MFLHILITVILCEMRAIKVRYFYILLFIIYIFGCSDNAYLDASKESKKERSVDQLSYLNCRSTHTDPNHKNLNFNYDYILFAISIDDKWIGKISINDSMDFKNLENLISIVYPWDDSAFLKMNNYGLINLSEHNNISTSIKEESNISDNKDNYIWNLGGSEYTLNRETLELWRFSKSRMGDSSYTNNGSYLIIYKCNLYDDKSTFESDFFRDSHEVIKSRIENYRKLIEKRKI